MSVTKRYHTNIAYPLCLNKCIPSGRYLLSYLEHALIQADYDEHATIDLPLVVSLNKSNLIEIITEDGIIKRLLYKFGYDGNFDLYMVIAPGAIMKVITVYLEEKTYTRKLKNCFDRT